MHAPEPRSRRTAPFALLLAGLPLLAADCSQDPQRQEAEASAAAAIASAPATTGPRVTLRLSGSLEGRLEPCGCASGQIGGLARRSFRLQGDRGRYDFLIEGGDLVGGGTVLDELKLMTLLTVLDDRRARYDAVALGPRDLQLDSGVLAGFLDGFPQLAFVASDLVATPAPDQPAWPTRPFVDLAKEGCRVRIASLARAVPTNPAAGAPAFERLEPAAAWERAMAGVDPASFRVLLVHGAADAARACATLTPRPDLLVAIGDTAEPPHDPEFVDGVPLVQPGVRGRHLLDVTLAREGDRSKLVQYAPFALEGSRTAKGALQDADVDAQILAHRHEVKAEDARSKLANRLPTANGAEYVGSTKCASCHYAAGKAWEASKHGHAWRTLESAEETKRYAWPVTWYPDCIACHTVGYGERSGFVSPEATPDLRGVGCESCHGAGSRHAADPTLHRLGKVDTQRCTQCHDYEQSPDFDYPARWKLIEHGK